MVLIHGKQNRLFIIMNPCSLFIIAIAVCGEADGTKNNYEKDLVMTGDEPHTMKKNTKQWIS